MSDLIHLLSPLLTERLEAKAGTTLFRQGDEVRHWYVVRTGCVQLIRYSEGGTAAMMQRASDNALLAESSVFSPSYHCDGLVVDDAILDRANIASVRADLLDDVRLLEALTRHLASEVQRTRSRVELLTHRTVRERLDGWLVLNSGTMPRRGEWKAIADDIGVSPEAFYRELHRRRAGNVSKPS